MTLSEYTIKRKIPIYAFFELTRHCNLQCVHCYISKEKRQELSLNQIKEAISQLRKANSLILNFSGGEVFTRKDFFDIAWHAKNAGFAVKIFTNGTLISKAVASEIARLRPLRVEISIFSIRPNIHDGITGILGSFEKSLNALELLHKRHIPLRIKSPLLRQNVSGYKEIIKLAERLNAKYQFDPIIMPKTNGARPPLGLRAGKEELFNVLNDTKANIGKDRSNIPCSAGHNSCAISCYGDVFPCIILPISLGNLKRNSFSEIWHNSYKLKKLRDIRLKDLTICYACRLLPYCNRCPGLAYLEDRDILAAPKRACEIAEICQTIQK